MGFRRGTIFYFNDGDATGINNVPVGYKVVNRDTTAEYLVSDKTGLTGASTLADAIGGGNLTSLGGGGGIQSLMPTLSVNSGAELDENSTTVVTINSFDPEAKYYVRSNTGDINGISNTFVEITTATFNYKAYDITDGGTSAPYSSEILIYKEEWAKATSDTNTVDLVIVYLSAEGDTAEATTFTDVSVFVEFDGFEDV
jgi:hypothetical protein